MVRCNWCFDKEPCPEKAIWAYQMAKICEKHYRKVLELNPLMEGRYTRISGNAPRVGGKK
jgi:hypothetical protein